MCKHCYCWNNFGARSKSKAYEEDGTVLFAFDPVIKK